MYPFKNTAILILVFALLPCMRGIAQENNKKIQAVLYDGTVVAGYSDKGGYVNCTGPGIKYKKGNKTLLVGLLPSLRIKKDDAKLAGATKNNLITPSLGFGITATFHHFALQIPAFYNNKTTSEDGKWHLGVGVGYKF